MPKMIDPETQPKVKDSIPEVPITENYWEIKDFPSQSRFYNGQKIFGRPLKVLDLKKLAAMDDSNTTETIETIIRRCTKGINVEEILTPDKLYILFWLRYNTYKDKGYQVKYSCQHCNKETEYFFDLNMLDVTNLSEEMYQKMNVKISSGEIVKLRYQTMGIEKEVEAFTKKYSNDPLFEMDEDVLNLAACISGMPLKNRYQWLVDLNPSDYGKLESVMDEIGIGVVPFITATCKLCKGENLLGTSFRTQFLFPSNFN
jgi:hypothetical protein